MLPGNATPTQQDGRSPLAGFPASALMEPPARPLVSSAAPLPRLGGFGGFVQPDGLFPFGDVCTDTFACPGLLDPVPSAPYEGGGLFVHGGTPFGLELAPKTFATHADLLPGFDAGCEYPPCTPPHGKMQEFCPPLTPLAEYTDTTPSAPSPSTTTRAPSTPGTHSTSTTPSAPSTPSTQGGMLDVNASEFHPRLRRRTPACTEDTGDTGQGGAERRGTPRRVWDATDSPPPAGSVAAVSRTPSTPHAAASVRRVLTPCDSPSACTRQPPAHGRYHERRTRSNVEPACTQSPPALKPKSRSSMSSPAGHAAEYVPPCYRARQGLRREELERLREQEPAEVKERRLAARQRQIDFGVDTEGYRNLCRLVPEGKRSPLDPAIPNKCQNCSKRSWDGQIRKWRRLLHLYDGARTFEDVVAIRRQIERIQEEARECRRQGRSPASALPSPPSAVRRRECEKARRSKLRNELAQADALLAACERELSTAPSDTLHARRRALAAQRTALAAQLRDLERAHGTPDAQRQTRTEDDGRTDSVERELGTPLGALCFDDDDDDED